MTVMILAEQQPRHGARLSTRAENVLRAAAWYAQEAGDEHVGTDHIAKALLREDEGPHVPILRSAGARRLGGRG